MKELVRCLSINMQIITINDKQFYSSVDLKKCQDPNYYDKCGKSNHKFLERYDLDEDVDYNYTVKNKATGIYTITRRRSKGTILLVSKDWIDNFQIVDNTEPPLLDQADIKPFIDDEGYIYDVEIRGERDYRKCYFLASDIAECFDIQNLETHLTRERNQKYVLNIHYRRFCLSNGKMPLERQNSRLFLTYKGLMSVLFSSKTPAANKFVDWACELVFTAHVGTQDQKLALAADLIGLTKDQVKQFFDTCTSEISGLYLIDLGIAGDLRQIFQIPETFNDQMHVYKFGRSNNIAKRFQQHVRAYAKLKIYNIRLVYYCPIDSESVAKAESELRDHFEAYDMKLDNSTHTEIAIFEAKGKKIKGVFEQLFKIHMTTNIALINKLKEARREIDILKDKLVASETRNSTMSESYERERQIMVDKYQLLQESFAKERQTMMELNELKIKSLQAKIRRRDKRLAAK